MEKIDLSKCKVECHFGREMHTHKVNFSYKAAWIYVDCDESSIQDNTQYKVWLVTKNSDNLDDLSSETTVSSKRKKKWMLTGTPRSHPRSKLKYPL